MIIINTQKVVYKILLSDLVDFYLILLILRCLETAESETTALSNIAPLD